MSSRSSLLLIVTITVWVFAACNYTVGECWRRGEGPEGAGAGPGDGSVVLSSSASGDFGDAPPREPQDANEPKLECNKSSESSEESPPDSQESPPAGSPCPAVGDVTGDGQTYVFCSDACSSTCPPAGVNGFSPSIFKFVTTIPDDGTGPAGGWQQASVRLKIKRLVGLLPESWECPQMTLGMPLRNTRQGRISADTAARVSAKVASKATRDVMKPLDIPQGIYCVRLKDELKIRLAKSVDGATVTQP